MKNRMKKIMLTVILCGLWQQGNGMNPHDEETNPRKKRRIECEQMIAAAPVYDESLNRDLEYAVYFGKKDRINFLLGNRANPNARSLDGSTPLMYAAGHGDAEIVKMLLDAGADITMKDCNGDTALNLAKANGRAAVLPLLEEAQRDFQIRQEQKKLRLAALKETCPQCPLELIDQIVADYL